MATLAGAIVQNQAGRPLAEVLDAYGIVVEREGTPWTLIDAHVRFNSLVPPQFAEGVSRELDGVVLAFFIQTTSGVEEIQHWEKGRLVRRLEYSLSNGGWIVREGTPQEWESDFFFASAEGTQEHAHWPHNLRDDISDEDRARYEDARNSADPSSIMDLLHGGSSDSLLNLCEHFGVDPKTPGGIYTAPASWWPRLFGIAVVLFALGAYLLGARSSF